MTLVSTLYHPRFEPPEAWLRAMLLFYETVHSIVPEDAGYQPSEGVAALCEQVDDAFVTLSPTPEDLAYDWDRFKALDAVLEWLPRDEGGGERVVARLEWDQGPPRLDLGRGARVHRDKMGAMLVDHLVQHGLAEQREGSDWVSVDRRVGDLVLSMLADRMAKNREDLIYTCSDRETAYAVAAKSELNRAGGWNREATLASAILSAEVPADIAEMPLDRYIELRKRYLDKGEAFRLAMQELENLYFQQSFAEPEAFGRRLDEVITRFGGEMDRLRSQRLVRNVRRWAPVTLSAVVSVAELAMGATPIVSSSLAGTGLALEVLNTARGEPVAGTNVARSQATLVGLGRELRWNRNWLGRVLG